MQRQQIILIDPEESLRQALGGLLSRFDCRMVYAPAAQPAMQLLHRNPDIALAVVAYGLEGIGALETIRALRRWKQGLPVVVMAPPQDCARCEELAADGPTTVLAQPVNLGQLLLHLSRMLGAAAQEPQEPVLKIDLEARAFFTIVDISETGCRLRSHFPLERNHIIVLESPELARRLELPAGYTFPVRVCGCEAGEETRTYSIGAQFVGMSAELRSRLRAACLSVKGFKFTGSSK